MIRLFIALDLPSNVKEKLQHFTESLATAEARIIKAKNLHLTLKFLGYTENNLLPAIYDELKIIAAKHAAFNILLDRLGAFPSKRQARILWVGSESNKQLESLANDLDNALSKYGFEQEKRSFKVHLTLARFKKPADLTEILDAPIGPASEKITHFALFESKLSPKGAQYKVLEKYFFKKA